jgi:osmotically-inducible protein OsmY
VIRRQRKNNWKGGFSNEKRYVRKGFIGDNAYAGTCGLAGQNGVFTERSKAMKKRNRFVGYFVLLVLIATFAACASTSKQESTGEYIDDSVITTKVKSLLAGDDFLKSFQISVETYKGTVQLSGFVGSEKAVDKADQIARSVKGVKSVKNDLIVK